MRPALLSRGAGEPVAAVVSPAEPHVAHLPRRLRLGAPPAVRRVSSAARATSEGRVEGEGGAGLCGTDSRGVAHSRRHHLRGLPRPTRSGRTPPRCLTHPVRHESALRTSEFCGSCHEFAGHLIDGVTRLDELPTQTTVSEWREWGGVKTPPAIRVTKDTRLVPDVPVRVPVPESARVVRLTYHFTSPSPRAHPDLTREDELVELFTVRRLESPAALRRVSYIRSR